MECPYRGTICGIKLKSSFIVGCRLRLPMFNLFTLSLWCFRKHFFVSAKLNSMLNSDHRFTPFNRSYKNIPGLWTTTEVQLHVQRALWLCVCRGSCLNILFKRVPFGVTKDDRVQQNIYVTKQKQDQGWWVCQVKHFALDPSLFISFSVFW